MCAVGLMNEVMLCYDVVAVDVFGYDVECGDVGWTM